MKRHLLPACLFSVMPVVLAAQTVRGVVVDQLDRPLAGVVIQLTDTAAKVRVRTLSNERGEFRLTAPAPGRFRVRSTRIGFRPSTTELFELTAGTDLVRRLTLASIPVVLQPVTSSVRTACRPLGLDSTAATFTAWEQVRAALTAAELTAEDRQFRTTTLTYERRQTTEGLTLRQRGAVTTAMVTQPWHSLSADSLRKAGYVMLEPDGESRVFHGPDVAVLGSDTFLEDHCFHLVGSDDQRLIGIAFEPTPARKNMPEIKGTVWMDRATAELRDMEWQFLNVARNVDESQTTGLMRFARIKNGAWVISRWSLHLPLVEMAIGTKTGVVAFRGVKTVGGEVLSASSASGSDTLWAREPMTLRGFAYDSLNKKALTQAFVGIAGSKRTTVTDSTGHFVFDSLAPGLYHVITQHDALEAIGISAQSTIAILAFDGDSVNVTVPSFETIWRLACESTPPAKDTALVYGTIRGYNRARPVTGATVMATWVDLLTTGKRGFGTKHWRLDGTSDSTGSYVLCGVPTQTGIRMRAVSDSSESGLIDILPLNNRLVQRQDLVVSFDPNARGVVSGIVVGRSAIPIAGARVGAEGVKETRTDAQGRFVLRDMPVGTQQVEVLAVGLQPVSRVVEISPSDTAQIEVHVTKPVMLQRVNVVASSVRQQFVDEFNGRKTRGLGTFRDSTFMAGTGTLASAFSQIPGIRVLRNNYYLPRIDGSNFDNQGCLANVWIDGVKVQSQDDLLALRPTDIAAVEVYPRELMVPQQFLVRNSRTTQCGVIVVWTKWYWEGYQGKTAKPPV